MSKKNEKLNEEQNQPLQQTMLIGSANESADKYLDENILEARTNFNKAANLYRNYVGKAETREERLRRINRFRCGGW